MVYINLVFSIKKWYNIASFSKKEYSLIQKEVIHLAISKELEERIIDLFCNTKLKPNEILRIINNEEPSITMEDFYDFLYNYRTSDGKELKRNIKTINSNIDDQIYKLRIEGYSSSEISEILKKQNNILCPTAVFMRCKKIFEEKGEELPTTNRRAKKSSKVSVQEIYDLIVNGGLTKKQVVEYYKDQKIKISYDYVCRKYREYCEEQMKSEKDIKKLPKSKQIVEKPVRNTIKNLINRQELYELRKSGMTLEAIAKYYNEKGMSISGESIRGICKEIFAQKGEEEPKYNNSKKRMLSLSDEVLELRRKGFSVSSINNKLTNEGKKTNEWQIRKICKISSKENNEVLHYKSETKMNVPDETIYKLRKQGMTIRQVTDYLNKNGIKVSFSFIAKNSKRISDEKQEKFKIAGKRSSIKNVKDKKVLIDAILKIGERRKASEEQLKTFAKKISEYYGEDIDISSAINNKDINER